MTGETGGPSYGKTASRGVIWTSLANGLGRFTAFIAQWVLGYLLSDEDFGVYAIALSASSLVLAFQNAGFPRVLVQRGAEFERIGRPIWILALVMNVLVGLVLCGAAPALGLFYDEAAIAPLVWIIAISVPLGTPGALLRAKLSIDLRFRDLAVLTSASMVVRHGSTILFALLGFKAMSFVLPFVVVAVYQAIHGAILVGWMPRQGDRTRDVLRELFPAVKWLLLAAVAIAAVTRGDYIVVGKLESKAVTGQYFFAFQLVVALTIPFTQSLAAVMVPTLVRLRDEPARYTQAYLRALRSLFLASAPLAVGALLVVGPAIHVLWNGKWDVVIFASQVLAVSLAFSLARAVALSVVESHGRWRLLGLIYTGEAVSILLAAGLGAWWGGLDVIAMTIASARILTAILVVLLGSRLAGLSLGRTVRAMTGACALAAGVGALVYLVFSVWIPIANPFVQIVANGGSFTLLFTAAAWLIFPAQIRSLLAVVVRAERSS